MKKSVRSCLLCMTLFMLSGCGNEIPEMDETTEKMIVEYAADAIRNHDINHSSRLMEVDALQAALEEEAMLEAVFSKDYSAENIATETDTVDNENSKAQAEVMNDASEAVEANAVSLAEALALADTQIDYAGYEIVKSYPAATENIYFSMDATDGNELVVMKFDVSNTSQNDRTYDMLSQSVHFKIVIDGESKNALTTMLLNDLSSYQGTIAAGAKEQLVLVCEVSEEQAQSISQVALDMKTADEIISIALK